MEYEVIKTMSGPGISLKRGYSGPINMDKGTITNLLNAGYIVPVKAEKKDASLKGKETLSETLSAPVAEKKIVAEKAKVTKVKVTKVKATKAKVVPEKKKTGKKR